jgi:pyrroline-5-carboxylate reductase
MSNFYRVAFIGGAGMMGRALVEGLLQEGVLAPANVVVTARSQKSLNRLSNLDVVTTLDNCDAVSKADVVVLAVHPDQALPCLSACAAHFRPEQLLISVVTAMPLAKLKAAAGGEVPVIRAMPNIAATVRCSVTTLTFGPEVTDEQLAFAEQIFGVVGDVFPTEEKHLNACTGLGACGPAFAFKMIESLAEGGVKMGLPRDVSRRMAAGVLRGAAELVLKTGKHPAELKDEVTTPGGCTIDGIAQLEERGLPIALIAAVEVSTRKAAELDASSDESE